jgi:hypothetical protein
MTLELVKTKNEQFKEEYPSLKKKIMEIKLNDYEPKIDEIRAVYKIIIDYIKQKKLKIYGGYALNIMLKAKDPKLAIYDELDVEVADIDFYSPNALDDLVNLCDKIYESGYKPVVGLEAQHNGTYSLFVNYRLYCDISYMPNNIYHKAKFLQIDGFNVIHPWFMMIDYFRMFTDPMTSYWRLDKHFERYMRIQKTYPLPLIQKPLLFPQYKNPEISSTINLLFDYLTDKSSVLMTGFYIYNYYLYDSGYMKQNKSYEYINIPYLEAYSTDYVADGLDILEFVNTLANKEKITHKEYYPFFQYYGYNFVLYYNDKDTSYPILYFYSNNKRCIPYKSVEYVKFENGNKSKPIVNPKKKINIGCFDYNILHALIILAKVRVDDDNDWNDILYKYINGLVTFRNYYLDNKKETIYSTSIYQGFVIDCMGETIAPDREKRLLAEVRKKLGKPYSYKYEAGVSKSKGKYVFQNSSGNEITNSARLKLKKENLNKKMIDEIEGEENESTDNTDSITDKSSNKEIASDSD